MVDLKVMAYFKLSLSTHNWDRAFFIPLVHGQQEDDALALSPLEPTDERSEERLAR